MKNNLDKYKDIYLAKIVSFDNYSVLFQINDLEPFTEDYILIKIYPNGWAYNLIENKRYKVLTVTNGIINGEDLDKIQPYKLYVYDTCSFIDIWSHIKNIFGIQDDLDTFFNKCSNDINELNNLLSSENKIIDFNRVKKLTNERKY